MGRANPNLYDTPAYCFNRSGIVLEAPSYYMTEEVFINGISASLERYPTSTHVAAMVKLLERSKEFRAARWDVMQTSNTEFCALCDGVTVMRRTIAAVTR